MLRIQQKQKKKKKQAKKPSSSTSVIHDAMLDDALNSATRTLHTLEDTNHRADETLDVLGEQGEQINRIQGQVDKVSDREKMAKRDARSISSVFWALANKIIPHPSKTNNVKKKDKSFTTPKEKPKKTKTDQKTKPIQTSDLIDKSQFTVEELAKLQATEKLVDNISDRVDDFSNQALAMRDELKEQDKKLQVLDKTIKKADTGLGEVQRMMRV